MEIKFSIDNYDVNIFLGTEPCILDHYQNNAVFVDIVGLQQEGTMFYCIIATTADKPQYRIFAWRSESLGYAGFAPHIYFCNVSKLFFIGAGTLIKCYDPHNNRVVYEKDYGFGFWSWHPYGDYVIYTEETAIGAFDIYGNHLFEIFADPPYTYKLEGAYLFLHHQNSVEKYLLSSGQLI
jgi:hypothetical protein